MANASPPSGLAGRTAEIEALRAALARAFAGESTSVLVGGEPGIGKTALCHAALTALVDPAVPRLLISCLPLQSLASGLAPLRTALRRSSASAALTRTCLARLDEGDVLRAVDDWVEDVVAQTPVVIVVDDVQWAESSLRDVLLYLLAGPADRRLAVLLTVRSTGLPDRHPLHGWLADVLRASSRRAARARAFEPGGHRGSARGPVGWPSAPEPGRRRGRGKPRQSLFHRTALPRCTTRPASSARCVFR